MPDEKRFCPGKFVPVLKIEGNVSRLRANPAHLVGHLPYDEQVVNALKVRQNRSQGSNFAFKVWLEQIVSFPMSLSSGMLCRTTWKFIGWFAVVSEEGGHLMAEIGVRGIDLFKIAGESISGW